MNFRHIFEWLGQGQVRSGHVKSVLSCPDYFLSWPKLPCPDQCLSVSCYPAYYHQTTLHSAILNYTLNCTTLHYTILYYTALHYNALHSLICTAYDLFCLFTASHYHYTALSFLYNTVTHYTALNRIVLYFSALFFTFRYYSVFLSFSNKLIVGRWMSYYCSSVLHTHIY